MVPALEVKSMEVSNGKVVITTKGDEFNPEQKFNLSVDAKSTAYSLLKSMKDSGLDNNYKLFYSNYAGLSEVYITKKNDEPVMSVDLKSGKVVTAGDKPVQIPDPVKYLEQVSKSQKTGTTIKH